MSTRTGQTNTDGVKTSFNLTCYDNEYWEYEVRVLKIYPRGEHRWKDRRFVSLSCCLLQGPPRDINVVFSAVSCKDTISVGNDTVGTISSGGAASCPKFLHHRVLLDPEDIFYKDEKLRVLVVMRVHDPAIDHRTIPAESSQRSCHHEKWMEDDCVVCLSRPRTSGFLHNGEAHICVCEPCARMMAKKRGLCCPICRKTVDRVIYKIY